MLFLLLLGMKSAIDLYNEVNQFGKVLGMDFKVLSPGSIEYRMVVKKEHLATPTVAHGGVIAGFMDAVLGVAALSAVAEDHRLVATIEFKITYLAPAFENDQLLGIGRVIKKGKRLIFTEGEILNHKNEIIAKASGTFTSYPQPELR